MSHVLARLLVASAVLAVSACDGNDTTGPSRRPSEAAGPFVPGRYELQILALGTTHGCQRDPPIFGPFEIPASGLHAAEVMLRREAGDWVATSTRAGDTLRLRIALEDWPRSPHLTGRLDGRAEGSPAAGVLRDTAVEVEGTASIDGVVASPTAALSDVAAIGTVSGRLRFRVPGGVATCHAGQFILRRPLA